MKNLKLLNKKYLSFILFYLFFGIATQSEEPIDIWNIEEKKTSKNIDVIEKNETENLQRIVFIKCNPKKIMKQI